MYKSNIVFDLDGTLIDSSEGIYSAYVNALKEMNSKIKSIDFYSFKKSIGPPFDKMSKKLHPDLNEYEHKLLNDY